MHRTCWFWHSFSLKKSVLPQNGGMDKNLSLRECITLTGLFALMLWIVKLCESMLGVSLSNMGVFPQTLSGLFGIIAAPLIHGSFQHLLSNTLPVLLLGSMLIYGYPRSRWWVLTIVWIASGLMVWLFARQSYHIGASGITHGVFFYLLAVGILRRDKRSSVLLTVAFFMYGTMIWSVFPQEPGISYEYHSAGALSGIVCALLFRKWDPKPLAKTYSWERDESDDDLDEYDPIIGDEWKLDNQP